MARVVNPAKYHEVNREKRGWGSSIEFWNPRWDGEIKLRRGAGEGKLVGCRLIKISSVSVYVSRSAIPISLSRSWLITNEGYS